MREDEERAERKNERPDRWVGGCFSLVDPYDHTSLYDESTEKCSRVINVTLQPISVYVGRHTKRCACRVEMSRV